MPSFATEGVLPSLSDFKHNETDPCFTDYISVTDRRLAQPADGDEYPICARWYPPEMNNRMSDLERVKLHLQIQRFLKTDMQLHRH
jgi:hypothetical protein